MKRIVVVVLVSYMASSCGAIKETSKFKMETGIYKVKTKKNESVYLVAEEEELVIHPVAKTKHGWIADTANITSVYLNRAMQGEKNKHVVFIDRSFDFDVLTILFKYRPTVNKFPNQLNTNFNGAGYLGHRSDLFLLSYDKDPLNTYRRRINHFGYSLGFFGGLGSTQMNPFVTGNRISEEYDGVVITKGVAGMIGIGNLTFGLAIGFDHLIDQNHRSWIYQGKPWSGLTLGLNLN